MDDKARLRVHLGPAPVNNFILTTHLQLAFVNVPPSAPPPPPLDTPFVYLHVTSLPLSSLLSNTFLAANARSALPSLPSPSSKRKPHPSHPLVALPSPSPRGSQVVLASAALTLSLPLPVFQELGLERAPAPRGTSARRRARNARVDVRIALPQTDSSRPARALAPPRIAPADFVLSAGRTAPVPPPAAGVAALRAVRVDEMAAVVRPGVCKVARRAVEGDESGFEGAEAAQMVLTGIGGEAGDDDDDDFGGGGGGVTVIRRRYVGICNGDMWDAAVECVRKAVEGGCCEFGIIGALGMWEGDCGESVQGFGGDAGAVAVMACNGKAVTFEMRPATEA